MSNGKKEFQAGEAVEPSRGAFAAKTTADFGHIMPKVTQEAEERAARYAQMIDELMKKLGVPRELRGIDFGKGKQVFNPREIDGGGVIAEQGIEVDAAILIPSRMDGIAPSWKTATISERAEAVIVHECVEYQFKGHPQAHKLTLQFAPEEARKRGASEEAIKILDEMKAAEFGK